MNPLRIVFLDSDGVLNNGRYVRARFQPSDERWTLDDLHPDAIETLNLGVVQTGLGSFCRVVVAASSTLDEVAALFRTRGFTEQVTDVTPRLFGEIQGAEIRTWLRVQRTCPQAFAVLDDEAATDDLKRFWIRAYPSVGQTVGNVQHLVALLTSLGTLPDVD